MHGQHLVAKRSFYHIVRRMRPALFLTLLAIGALAGFAVRELFLAKFEAKSSLPMSGDLATFREAEPLFTSVELFEKYGAKHNLLDDPDFDKLRQQFVRHLSGPIRIEHAFRLLRKDVRELPDTYAGKEEISRRVGYDRLQSDIEVYATAKDPASAIRLAKLTMGYASDCLAAVSLAAWMRRWDSGARTQLAENRESVNKLRSELESSDRRIKAMAELRERYKEVKDAAPVLPSSTASPAVQFQIPGTRNLSPAQQIIGLETDRAEIVEKLELAEFDRARLQALTRFADLYGARLNDGASLELAKEMLRDVRRTSEGGKQVDPQETALAMIATQLEMILSRFDEARLGIVQPEAVPTGVKRSIAVLIGMMAGIAIWWILIVLLPPTRALSIPLRTVEAA